MQDQVTLASIPARDHGRDPRRGAFVPFDCTIVGHPPGRATPDGLRAVPGGRPANSRPAVAAVSVALFLLGAWELGARLVTALT